MLNAALMVARREAGWRVSPETDVEITIDGPGSRILWLPTMKLNDLDSIEEDGTDLDLDTVVPSAGDGSEFLRRVALRKRGGGWWTSEYSGLVIAMNHGLTTEEAPDWKQAILSMVDQMSLLPVQEGTGSSDFGAATKRVDDIAISWNNPYAAMAEEVIFSMTAIICKYKLSGVDLL